MRASSRSVAASKLLTLARPLGGEVAIAADDQPFAREQVGRADLGKIALVEQRQLQRPILRRQRLDGRCTQAGDPIQTRRLEIVADAGRGDHAAISDQHHDG